MTALALEMGLALLGLGVVATAVGVVGLRARRPLVDLAGFVVTTLRWRSARRGPGRDGKT